MKNPSKGYDYERLQNTLVNSKVHTENKGLYQLLKQLIIGARDFQTGIDNSFNKTTDKLELASQVNGKLLPENGGTLSAYYLPDLIDIVNISNHTSYYTHVLISELLIQLFGKMNVTTSAGNILTKIQIVLPVSSKFSTPDQLFGVANGIPLGGGIQGFAGIVVSDVTSGNGEFQFYPLTAEDYDIRFMISYERFPK